MKGVRTIALRLTGTKEAAEELEEMGEDTSDMIMSQSKMRDLIMNATKVASNNYKGFDIQDELGRYKSTYEIMLGLSQIWEEIRQADLKSGDNRQNLLLESIAGKNRASIASSILQNPDVLQSVYQDSSTKAAGSAMEENQKYLDSISGHLAKLKNAWQEMWANAANRDVINGFIDLGTKILELINDAGLLKSAFTVLFGGTIIKGLTNANSLLVKYVQLLTQTKSLSSVLTETFANIFNKKLDGWEAIKQAWSNREQVPVTATPTQPQADTYQPNAYDEAINAQLIGQNVALDENTQKKRENAQAQRELTEATNEGTLSSAASTEQQTAETVANMENVTSSQEQAASELDEATAKSANLTATEKLNAAEQQEASTSMEAAAANSAQAESELDEATSKMASSGADVFDILTEAMDGVGDAASGMGDKVEQSVGGTMGLLTALGINADIAKAKLIGFFTSPAALLLAIPAAIGVYNKIISDYNKHQKDLIDQAHQASNAWADTQKSVQDYASKYNDLKSQLNNANLSEAETINIKKQIYDLQTQITDQYGKSASGLDLINGKLEQQLGIIQNITQEEAKRTYGSNREAYERAIGEMNRERNYSIDTQGLSQQEMSELFDGIDYEVELDIVTGDESAKTFKNVDKAEKDLNTLNDRLLTIKDSMTEGEWAASKYAKIYDDVSKAISANNDVIAENRTDARAGLETQLLMMGDSTGRDLQKNFKSAVEEYNQALITNADINKIEDAQQKVQELQKEVDTFLQGDNAKYSPLFQDIDDSINTALQDTFNLRQKMRSDDGKSIIESIFGDIKKVKKDSKEVNSRLLETAQHVIDLQYEVNDIAANKEGGILSGISPLKGIRPTETVFGNIDVNDREILKWTKATREKYQKAWASWGDTPMPKDGAISTIEGDTMAVGNVEIAFSPLLQTGEGEPEYLSKETVSKYLNDIVEEATDKKTGEVDFDKLIKIDTKGKNGVKQIVAGVSKIGDEASKKLANSLHFLGKDGAISLAFRDLAHEAREAGVPISEVMQQLQQYGNTSTLAEMLQDTTITAADVEDALYGADDAISLLLADMAQQFGITMDTPDEQIQAFINELASMGLVAADSTKTSQSSLDRFFKDTSSQIEQITSLQSVLQKGQSQTGLTFTKSLDEQGNQVASEVKTIIDAYKDLDGYDLGSLFEETGTGIKLNFDAYRALEQQREAETKRRYKLERAGLEADLAVASPDEQDAIKQKIIELDMLSSAYDGATSALQKYLNQQNAADYGDTYSMLQGTTLQRGDELLNKGLIGTEEFRSIAQLFSFKSLATADAQEVAEAYKTGAANVRKYFTEDAVAGVLQFATDIEQLPEKFGDISRDADGAFTFDVTDEQLNNLAEHFQVSTDVIEAFFDQIRATGGEVHLWRDGGFEDFKELDQNIEDSKSKLKELKEVSNDPELVSKLDWDISDIDTIDEMKQKITDMKDIQAKIGDPDTEAWKEAQKVIDDLESRLEKYEQAAENARNTSPITFEDFDAANKEIDTTIDAVNRLKKAKAEGQKVSILTDRDKDAWGSDTIEQLLTDFDQMPDEIRMHVVQEMGYEWEDGMTSDDLRQKIENDIQNNPIKAKVGADTTEAEQEVDQIANTSGTANIDAEVTGDKPLILQWLEGLHTLFTVNAEASEVEEVRKEAEEPIKTPMTLEPTNSAQEAANKAGAQQGVTTQVNEQHNITSSADTSGVDAMNTGLHNLQQIGNVQVGVNATVSGLEQVQTAKTEIDDLKSKDGSTVNTSVSVSGTKEINNVDSKVGALTKKKNVVTIQGNTAPFNTSYKEALSKLNEIDKKQANPTIKADNSKLKSAVDEAKRKLNGIDDKSITITAKESGFSTITNWKKNVYDGLKDKKFTVTSNKVNNTYNNTYTNKKPDLNGSAHASGTVLTGGHAYANGTYRGKWGLSQDENGSLVNEIGPELVVNARTGQWQILNGGYPTFANFKKGDIIFNADQTESLLKNGYIKGSYAKLKGNAFSNGTDPDIDESRLDELMGSAFAAGTAKWTGALSGQGYPHGTWTPPATITSGGGGGGGGNNNSGSHKHKKRGGGNDRTGKSNAKKTAKQFLETLDAIEIQLNRVDAKISQLDTTIGQTFQTFGTRAKNVTKEFSQLNKEIKFIDDTLKKADHKNNPEYNYLAKAKAAAKKAGYTEDEINSYKESHNGKTAPNEGRTGVDLGEGWIKDIQNTVDSGNRMTIQDVGDEGTWKKIQAYQTWYEKHVKLNQKKQEYINKLSQLTITNLQLIQTKYTTTLDAITSVLNGNENLRQLQTFRTNGTTTSTKNKKTGKVTYGMNWKKDTVNGRYENDIKQYQEQIKTIQKERKELQTALDVGVKKGYIKKNSEEFRKWTTQIANLGNDIVAAQTKIGEAASNQIQHVQDRWSSVLESLEGDLTGYTNKIEQFAFSTSANVFARTSVKSPATLRKEASKAKEKVGTTYDEYANAKINQISAKNAYESAERQASILLKKANKTGKASDRQKAEMAQIKASQARNNLYQANNAVSTAQSAYSTAQKNLKTANDRVKRAGNNPATITTTAKSLGNFTAGNDLTLNYIGKEYTTNKKKIDYLNAEAKQLQSKLDDAVSKGRIQEGSEEWRKWQQQIKDVNNEIIETQTALDQLAVDGLEHIQERWETSINSLKDDFEGLENTIDGFRYSQSSREATDAKRSKLVNFNNSNDQTLLYLDKEAANYRNQRARLEAEAKNLETYLNQAVENGQIKKNSQIWYEWQSNIKGVKNEIIEVTNAISEIAVKKLEQIQDRWETTIKYLNTMVDRFKSYADLQSTKGYEVSAKYYQEQIKYNTNQLANMRQEASNLESALNSAVASGQIAKYSAEWFEWYTEIEDIRNNIIDLQKDIAELNNEIRQLAWDRFDRIQDSISDVIDEMEFLNSVIYENDLFDDNGKVTKKGMASAALIAQQFDLARRSADKYKTEILNINKEIAKDPYNQDLLKRRKELIKAQQESIENAQKQKQAMVDLAEKGIKKQIDAMNELISKYEEALDKQRQQEQYAKNMANQQKSIASLEKQLRSMRGDDSEEGRARRQQLEDQLKNARESLKDSQEDKRLSDIKEALSELQERYQDVLNERLDNIDRLFAEAIDVINENGVTISNTIKSVADSVGYNMTDTLAKTYEGVKNTLINGVNSLVSTINTKNGNLVNNNATTLKADTAITNQENKAEKAADTQASNTIKAVTTTPRITTTTTTTTPRKDTGTTTPKNNSATTTPKKDTGTTTPKKETPAATPKKTTTTTPDPKKVAIQNATNKYNNAKNTTTAAQTRVDSAKSSYNNAVKAQKDAQAALKNAQSILTNAQNTYNKSKTTANKNKLDQARSSLTLAQARLSAANTKVSSTQAALNTANKNLTTAKEQEVAVRNALEKLDPTKKNGLRTEGGHIYYYVKGVAQKGWRVISGYRYYFDGQGRAVKNQLRNIDGTTYYFDSKGHMAQRDIIIDDTKYKIQANGKVVQAERNGKVIKKYAKGTKSVPQTDLYQVDEKGQEVFINSNGKIYTRLEKGTAVLPHKAAVNLLEGMSNPVGFIKDHMDLRPNKNITSTTSGDTYNNVTFNMPNVTNYNEFMREAQKDPNFTKYIQEISLGKMNGNNSMKGRAVRFR